MPCSQSSRPTPQCRRAAQKKASPARSRRRRTPSAWFAVAVHWGFALSIVISVAPRARATASGQRRRVARWLPDRVGLVLIAEGLLARPTDWRGARRLTLCDAPPRGCGIQRPLTHRMRPRPRVARPAAARTSGSARASSTATLALRRSSERDRGRKEPSGGRGASTYRFLGRGDDALHRC